MLNESLHDTHDGVERLRKERDFYRKLLALAGTDEIEVFLREALALMVEIAGARLGYIELRDERTDPARPDWWIAHGCSPELVASIRKSISRGVIARAMATGETIVTASALSDVRFQNLSSVQQGGIQAVLCAPVGKDPPSGVAYLQDRIEGGAFSHEDAQRVEELAQHVARFADNLIRKSRARMDADLCAPLRASLRVERIVGRSAALARVLREVALVAPRNVTVLLTGPTGTGKTEIARAIHENGPRAKGPFVEVNCAAVPEALAESELFGALQGAHSTATHRRDGRVGAAEGGTLFLDEVGELPLTVQAKLLQLLQSKTYFPLGSAKPLSADVRILAATNASLETLSKERRFREDLYFRLKGMPIRIPPLSERIDDIHEIAVHFLLHAIREHDLPQLVFSNGARRAMEVADWPGNVRQLANAVEGAALRAAADEVPQVEPRHLFPDPAPGEASTAPTSLSYQEATRRFQAQLVRAILEEERGNVVETARRLDLGKSHVYNLIKLFGLDRHGRGLDG